MCFDLYRCSACLVALIAMVVAGNCGSAQEWLPPGVSTPIDSFPRAGTMQGQPIERQPIERPPIEPQQDPATLDRLHWPLLRRDLQVNGAVSCATANCHGGPRVGVSQPWARRGMEYQIWMEDDPHARSWRTICSDRSVTMMERLGILRAGRVVDQAGFDNCLACHNSTRRYDEPRRITRRPALANTEMDDFAREGIGCSACHGPSERWIASHVQDGWSPSVAFEDGFVDAGDLYTRARMCASCHVGDKDRDMNHDIIAAGHPPLRYELATFHAWQPKHWRDREADDRTFYEAQLWLAGQVAATDASLALLQTRAEKAHSVSQWPELASYNCSSCHHDLALDNQRRPIDGNRKAVALYSQWDHAGIRWLIQFRIDSGEAIEQDHRLLAALDRVKDVMESSARPGEGEAAAAAVEARQALADWFGGEAGSWERHRFRSDRLGQMVASAAGRSRTYRSWESTVQFYLAAVAARESWPGGWHGPLRGTADRLRRGLRYPEMIDVSRFEKRGSGPTVNRLQAMQLGIELAGWLGPVTEETIEDDDDAVTESMRANLREMIERMNRQRGQSSPATPDRGRGQADPRSPDELLPPDVDQPPVTREQLLEQLRQRREAREQNNSNRDP
jgi:hypothetical protein